MKMKSIEIAQRNENVSPKVSSFQWPIWWTQLSDWTDIDGTKNLKWKMQEEEEKVGIFVNVSGNWNPESMNKMMKMDLRNGDEEVRKIEARTLLERV